jgi:hypothetical protein
MIFAEVADLFFFPLPSHMDHFSSQSNFLSLILFALGHEQEVTNGTDQRGTSNQG